MDLFFPQWQGSGATDEVYHGALLLRDTLRPKMGFVEVPVKPLHPLELEQNIWGGQCCWNKLLKPARF
jgi:hypothetical protein